MSFANPLFSGALAATYLMLHFFAYVAVLRRRASFRTERGIFLYHFASFAAVSVFTLVIALLHLGDAEIAMALAIIAAHGIYSMSFLELWSLAQGSYSIGILTAARDNPSPRAAIIERLAKIGESKKSDRLGVLTHLSLAHGDGEHWKLTSRGRMAGKTLAGLLWLANIKAAG